MPTRQFESLEALVESALSGATNGQEKVASEAAGHVQPTFDVSEFEKLASTVKAAMTVSAATPDPKLAAAVAELKRRGLPAPAVEKVASQNIDSAALLTLPAQMAAAASHIRSLEAQVADFKREEDIRAFATKIASVQNVSLDVATEIARDLHEKGQAQAGDVFLTRLGGHGIDIGQIKVSSYEGDTHPVVELDAFIAQHRFEIQEQF